MSEWKKVRIDFDTIKLGDFIEPIKTTVLELGNKNPIVYGVTNKEGIVQTGKPASKDISNYIALEDDCFAFNPYRVNVGSIGINDKKLKGCVSPAYIVFKTKNGLLPKFLYFYLKSDYGIHLINWYGNRGGVRNALRYSDLCNIDIPNINHLDQQKILEKFLSASEKIDEINKEIESQKNYIKKLRQNILQDAIEGKLTAEWRKQNPVQKGNPDYDAEALFEKIQKERSNEKKQKELSPITDEEKPFEIPRGWKWIVLNQIASIGTGATPLTSEKRYYEGGNIPWITSSATGNDFVTQADNYITQSALDETNCNLNPVGTLVVAMYGQGKTRGQVTELCIEAATNQACATIQLPVKNNEVLRSYVKLVFKKMYQEIRELAQGGAQPNLNLGKISNTVLPFPPLNEQKEIITRVEEHLHTVSDLENQITERELLIKQLMQSILKDAFEEI